MDGVPSTVSLDVLNSYAEMDPGSGGRTYIDCHVWLRNMLNKILVQLYGPGNAYGQPGDLAHLVRNLSQELQSWYASRPPSQQFERGTSPPGAGQPNLPAPLVRGRPAPLQYFLLVVTP